VVYLLEDFVEVIMRMMVLLFWTTYNRCSGHLMLLLEILPQVMARKPLIMVLRVSMLLNRCRRTVGTAVTLMESMMAEVAHLSLVEQHIMAAIKNSIDIESIRCTGASLHHQEIVGDIVRCLSRVYIPW
jgi:hypothetical protein